MPDLAAAVAFYADVMGAVVSPSQELPDHGVRVAFVELPNSRVELMEPLGPDSPLAGFMSRAPGGALHHLCYDVVDLPRARDRLRAAGLRVLGDGEPRPGAHGRPALFLHPKDAFGTLIELEEVRET